MSEQDSQAPETLDAQLAAAFAAARAGEQETEETETETEAEPATEEVVEAQTEVEETAETEEVEAEAVSDEGPSWLPKEDRELFAKAPENVRTAWERNFKGLQGNYTRATQQLKEKGESLSRFEQVLAPYMPAISQRGLRPEQAVEYVLRQYAAFSTDPKGYTKGLAQSVGLSLDSVDALSLNTGLDDPRISQLEQRLSQVQQSLTTQQRSQAAAAQQSVASEIKAFAEAKGADGNPSHPHFAKVQDSMAMYVGAGKTMAEAYDLAVRADPELFEQIVSERTKAAMTKRTVVKKVATKAKASGSGIAPPKDLSKLSLGDQLKYNYDQAKARAS